MGMALLAKRDPDQFRRACKNSAVVVLAYDQTHVGSWKRKLEALSDGDCATIYDVVILLT